MNQFFDMIGNAITSMAAIIFVLVMTIIAMIFFSHTLFYEIFPPEMAKWEKSIATWTLACAWELTVLVTTCNTQFIHRRVPIAMAICSGFIILLFIHGFDMGLTGLEYFRRWLVGLLVATINIVFAGLFYAKWCESKKQRSLEEKLIDLEWTASHQHHQLTETRAELEQAKNDFDQLFKITVELEKFKEQEIKKLTCPHCKMVLENIYQLTSHKGKCEAKTIEINGQA